MMHILSSLSTYVFCIIYAVIYRLPAPALICDQAATMLRLSLELKHWQRWIERSIRLLQL